MAAKSHRRPGKKKRSRVPRTPKPGDAYQDVVALVAKSLAPSAEIEVGAWTDGPDGRRDLDVVVRQNGADSAPLVVIECKDWNRPIGIALIDALDSKRRDIGASIAMICSNSGFTVDALRKAARVGITALAALIEGDNRIRVVVREQIYTRIVEFAHHSPLFHHPSLSVAQKRALAGPLGTKEWIYRGKSVEAWISAKLLKIAGLATHSRSFLAIFRFLEPIRFDVRGHNVLVNRIDIRAADQRPSPGMPAMEVSLAMIKNMPQSDPKDAPNLDTFIFNEEIVDEDPGEGPTGA